MFTIEDMLARLDRALKSMTVTDLGASVLVPEQFERFIREVRHETVVLKEAAFTEMKSKIKNIDRIGFAGQVLSRGRAADGTKVIPGTVKPATATNQLIARELVSITGLEDDTLRENIERGNLESTLIDIFAEAASLDLEYYSLLADTESDPDSILSLTDGWIKQAANKVYGGAGEDFDPTDGTFPENMFDAMITAIPKQFLKKRNDWRIYCDFETHDGYANLLKERNTALGDLAQTKGEAIPYKGIEVVYCPALELSAPVGERGAGRVALLSIPKNMLWGVFHEMTIEPSRKPEERETRFVLVIEADADYEDENAAVAALIDQSPIS